MSISLCMIVKNEELNLPSNLQQATKYVDEIVIIDTGSSDNTIAIAKKYGAIVKEISWKNDFAKARNEAIKHASKDWILVLDADEILYAKEGLKLKDFLKQEYVKKIDGFIVTVCNYIEPNNTVSAEKNKSLRLFRNNNIIKYEGKVHEQVKGYSKISEIPLIIYHSGYLKTEIIRKNKQKRNRELLQNSLVKDPNNLYYKYHLAINSYSDTKYQEAIDLLESIIPFFGGNESYAPRAYKCLIISYKQLKNFNKMVNIANTALKQWPDYTDLHYLKAVALYNIGNYGQALSELTKCLELGEAVVYDSHSGVGSTKPLLLMANIYYELGNINSAIEKLDKLVKILPDSPSVYAYYCDLLMKSNKNELVKKLLLNYCNKYRQLVDDLINELYLKKLYSLIDYLINNIKEISYKSALKYSLACVHLKNYDTAVKNFRILLNKVSEVEKRKLTINIFLCLWSLGRIDEAKSFINDLLNKETNDSNIQVFLMFANSLILNDKQELKKNNLSEKQIKEAVLLLVRELEPYQNNKIMNYLKVRFFTDNLQASDLIEIFDERPIPDCFVDIYLKDTNLSLLFKYKRFMSLSNRSETLYNFLIAEGCGLLSSGATLVKVYSKLSLCYQIKANKVRRNYLE
ncbi:glycosyltransferase [Clostridium sp. 'deep sea']|uniref:glycosyltransferase family 2 protein n=1 Tax=Clostridium sp. 'deep sea' TaxID=2779445 RepID=UPI0018966356|nr:glycosyltransferase family 2 protein [Clostridium sp. 'deep sea']QOR36420.1 glycosyltransferase [Clostridium sp. 'deep sea']